MKGFRIFGVFFVTVITSTVTVSQDTSDLTPTRPYTYRQDLAREKNKFVLFWDTAQDYIIFEVHARTQGWVGLGISREGGMIDTDIALGWVKDDGTAVLQDRYSLKNDVPTLDNRQSLTLISGRKTSNYVILAFSRPLKACEDDDVSIEHTNMKLVWAVGTDIPPDGGNPNKHRTEDRGIQSVLLLSSPGTEYHKLPADATFIDLKATNVQVKTDKASVYIAYKRLTGFDKKRHLVMWEPIIQPGNEDMAHHMVGFLCYKRKDNVPDEWSGWSSSFQSELYWPNHIAVWTVGGGKVWLPDDTGIAVGGPDVATNKLEYVMLQMLYHNGNQESGRRDSSGIRLWVTEILRPVEAAVIMVGSDESSSNFVIPPKSESFVTNGYCPSECLQQGFQGQTSITVPMVLLHSHVVGSSIVVRHARNGIEMAPIVKEKYHDPEYQEFRTLRNPVTVRHTDDIIVECTFDTTEREGFTTGAFDLEDEMCLAIFLVTPHVPFRFCGSNPSDAQLLKFLNLQVEGGKVTTPGTYLGMTPVQVLNDQDWSSADLRTRFESNTREGEMKLRCQREHWNGTALPVHGQFRNYALPSVPYTEPVSTECQEQTSSASASVHTTILPMLAIILLALCKL